MVGSTAYNRLMHELCAVRGWCGGIVDREPSHVDDFIPDSGEVTANEFIDWLFKAEGYEPSHEPPERVAAFRTEFFALFVQVMGAAQVDATQLKWDLDDPKLNRD
ncbi:hypothetical protein [Tsuneonella mangrovi]|uniref:hypothetical protein n=1 Tax=Tsuneonella mangrovi TaxID=1982042 RepID=UPI00123762A6|nr:hypothetical protein [Tsuneonella mangrovi]